MGNAKRWVLAALAAAAMVVGCGAREARAAGGGQVVAIVVEGAHAEEVAAWLEDRVAAPDTLKEEASFRPVLRAKGALPLRRDDRLLARVRAAATDAGVDRVILVDVRKTRSTTRVHVWDLDVHEGTPRVDGDVQLGGAAGAMETARAVLGMEPPRRAAKPPEPPPPPAAPPGPPAPSPPAADAPPEPDHATPGAPLAVDATTLSLRAALGVGTRRFSYSDRVTPTLRPYDLGGAPLAAVSGVVYPLAWTRTPVVRDLGLVGAYGRAFALSSQDSAGNRVDTTWQSFDVGATVRIPVGPTVIVDPGAGYGGDDFQFTQALAGGAAALPSVAYRFLRVGADLRWRPLRALTAVAGASYLDVLSTGYTSTLFPRQSAAGVTGRLGASYALAGWLAVSLDATYTRVFYSFNPVPGDASVAGGALDEQTRVVAGLSFLM